MQTTFPDEPTARVFATRVVERKLAACVQIFPALQSLYHWNGTLETAAEVLVQMKTTDATLEKLRQLIDDYHPYDVPEQIWFHAEASVAFGVWVHQQVNHG